MSRSRVLLWRHGQTDYNLTGRLQGQVDVALNEAGVAQAASAARVLARLEPAAIVSSDLGRAVATASALAGLIGLEVHEDARLRERSFGIWEGLTHAQMQDGWPEAYAQWRRGGDPDGVDAEPRTALAKRVAAAVNDWSARFAGSECVVFVAHGAAIATGITGLLEQDVQGWRGIAGVSNCHWSVLHPADARPRWRLTEHNVGVPGPDFPRPA